jgi:hypothetical protein
MILLIIAFYIFYIWFISKIISDNITINNQLIELRIDIIKINSICETLSLSKLNINIECYYMNYNRLYDIIILLLSNIILILYCIQYKNNKDVLFKLNIIICLSYLIIISISLIYFRYSNNNYKQLQKKIVIKNKKDEINTIYKNRLYAIIDNDSNISNINNSIDEYIFNYSYLFNLRKDKKIVLIELRDEMIKIKSLIPEIVNKDLEDYKKSLELKINELIGLCQTNDLIININ